MSEEGRTPWTNVYGLARSILALGTLITLCFDSMDALFRPLGLELAQTATTFPMRWSFFTLFSGEKLGLGRIVAVLILLLVISGWRPRFTGVLHWWITASYASSAVVIEGGDQIAAILTLLLIPVSLTDSRRWHWAELDETESKPSPMSSLVAYSCLGAVRLQVCVIYLFAFAGKVKVTEWANGTALYYWLMHPLFGVADWLQGTVYFLVSHKLSVAAMTWGALAVEALLAMGLLAGRETKQRLLWLGLGFHFAIAVAHGLVTFFLAMAAALFLYLRPVGAPFPIPRLVWKKGVRRGDEVRVVQ